MLTKRAFASGSGLVAAAALGACSPLGVFEALTPRDQGGTKAAGDVAYGSDPRQILDVYVPAGHPAGAPVAVFFYGGSWMSGSRADYAFVGEALAAQGFVTVVPDYRVYPQVRFPAFLDDCAAALRWAQDHAAAYGGDPSRIVLAGHSAGAYNAAMLALDPRYLRRAGVDIRTIRAFAGLSGPYDFFPFDEDTSIKVFGDAPDKAATQPVNFARRVSPPAFLATGDRDTTVRPKNTASLASRLRAVGVPVVERVYPGLDHADTLLALSVLLRGKAPILADMTAFLMDQVGAARSAAAR